MLKICLSFAAMTVFVASAFADDASDEIGCLSQSQIRIWRPAGGSSKRGGLQGERLAAAYVKRARAFQDRAALRRGDRRLRPGDRARP